MSITVFLHLHAEKIELRSETNMKFRVKVGDLTTVDFQGLDQEHKKWSLAIHQENAVCISEVILYAGIFSESISRALIRKTLKSSVFQNQSTKRPREADDEEVIPKKPRQSLGDEEVMSHILTGKHASKILFL